MPARRGSSLLAAVAAPVALLLVLWLAPSSSLRVPLALAAMVWAPGHAGLALLHPLGRGTLSGLERAGLACALGLVAAPVVGLGLSMAWSLTPMHVAVAALALTSALAVAATARARRPVPADATGMFPSPAPAAPSTRATVGISAAALLLAAAIFAFPLLSTPPATAALSLTDADGGLTGLDRDVAAGTAFDLRLEVDAGGAGQAGRLVATLQGPKGDAILLDQPMSLGPGQHATLALTVPALPEGSHALVVRWELPEARTLHLWLDAGAP